MSDAKNWARLIVWSHLKMRARAADIKAPGETNTLVLMFHAMRAASWIRGSNTVEQALPDLWERTG